MRSSLLTLLLALLLPAAATAKPMTPPEAAAAAYEINQESCVDVYAGKQTDRGAALVEVSKVYLEISSVYERSEVSYLLYWMGVLGQCLNQPSARDSFLEFLAAERDSTVLVDQVRDARRRLRFIKAKEGGNTAIAQEFGLESLLAAPHPKTALEVQREMRQRSVGSGVIAAAMGAITGGLLVAAAVAQGQATTSRQDAQGAWLSDLPTLVEARRTNLQATRAHQYLLISAAVTGGITGISFTATMGFTGRAAQAQREAEQMLRDEGAQDDAD